MSNAEEMAASSKALARHQGPDVTDPGLNDVDKKRGSTPNSAELAGVSTSMLDTTAKAVRPPAHDIGMASRFLAALDPAAGRFTFQFFGDGGDRYAEIFHGSLDELWPKVLELNTPERRIGTFVTISETNFQGRRNENILRPRAFFVDADTPDRLQVVCGVLQLQVRRRAWMWRPAGVNTFTGSARMYPVISSPLCRSV